MRVRLAGWSGLDEVLATVGDEPGADVVAGWPADRPLIRELIDASTGAQRRAVNVTVVQESARGLLDRVRERDAGLARPDPAVEGAVPDAPGVAVAFTPVQGEYGERSEAERVRGALEEWRADRALPWFELDVDLFEKSHARRPAQVEASWPPRSAAGSAISHAWAGTRARPPISPSRGGPCDRAAHAR